MKTGTLLAAIDLGSNSFRLEIGRVDQGQIQRVEYLKETVRLGNGLDDDRNLTPAAMQKGWDCLSRFAERLKGLSASQAKAVATQTLREAHNRDVFLRQGEAILGFPIEVISGVEEGRLIYQGVSHLLPDEPEPRLVIDIGGRSTEIIQGVGLRAEVVNSYRVGSVSSSLKHFASGELTQQALHQAEVAAQAIVDEAASHYPRSAWQKAYGASGTVGAVSDVLAASGWEGGVITREGLDWLTKCMIRAGHVDRLNLQGLKEDRKAVVGGGVSVLRAVMDVLQIPELHVADGALRQGLLYDMLERSDQPTDQRDLSVSRLANRFQIDQEQARRVESVAQYFFMQLAEGETELDRPALRKLGWAARLHEIGLAISHADHHKHGAYILSHAEVLGFSDAELSRLGMLLLGQRGKLRKIDADWGNVRFCRMLMCLRLAVLLCHSRTQPDMAPLRLHQHHKRLAFELDVPREWAQAHPQSAHLLRQEITAWDKTACAFSIEWSSRVLV